MRIFLSYGHDQNSPLVERIGRDLEAAGHEVWIDQSEIKAGEDWRRSIIDGLSDTDWVLGFLSKHSTRDPGVCLDELVIPTSGDPQMW
jgi:TIR domain